MLARGSDGLPDSMGACMNHTSRGGAGAGALEHSKRYAKTASSECDSCIA